MEHEKQFNLIKTFLNKHQYLYQLEVLERFPGPIPMPYTTWTQELMPLSLNQLITLENDYLLPSDASDEFKQFVQTCQQLSAVPQLATAAPDFPSSLKRKISAKKEHEVKCLVGLFSQSKVEQFVDIGSGAGHLSSCLIHSVPTRSALCFDSNLQFQEMGKKKLQKWYPKILEQLQFQQAVVDENLNLNSVNLKSKTAIIGLHSCGKLSVDVLKLFQKFHLEALASFGCCYHKLNDEYNLSHLAQQQPLTFSNHALTMAAKCYAFQDEQTYQDKIRVKKYRYALHFYCHNQIGKSISSTGNTHRQDAQLNFSQYLKKYLPASMIDQINLKEADQYIQSIGFQNEFDFYIRLGAIRSLLGRVIEIYIILDRVLWLKDQGIDVNVYQIFDRKLSPRNLGIIKV